MNIKVGDKIVPSGWHPTNYLVVEWVKQVNGLQPFRTLCKGVW